MGPPLINLQEEFIDHDLPIATSSDELDSEMSCALTGIFTSVDFTVVIGERQQRLRFFPELCHTYSFETDTFRFEGAIVVFLNQHGQEVSPRYQAYLRYRLHASELNTPCGELRLWPYIVS